MESNGMNEYASLKKNKRSGSALWFAVAILIVLEFCTVAVLGSQILSYSTVQKRNYIRLTEAYGDTKLTVTRKQTAKAPVTGASVVRLGAGAAKSPSVVKLSNDPKLEVYDANTVWSTHTDIEIFKIAYENGELVTTVNSFNNTDKVIAPGTENSYTFTLHNTGNKNLKYRFYVDAYFANTDYVIPVEAKMYDYKGKYLCGSADEWRPVLELDPIVETGSLSPDYIADYTIDWRWPFERTDGEGLDANDAFDTMLGNLAASGESLELHIIIRTEAELSGGGGGQPNPKTGEEISIPILAAVSLIAFVLILVLVFWKKKDREAEQA
ncbi:MAG: LPXTG cell wall anchor domain-containing protein [Clostridia bacterium]|nr:LPXTG cell wall anchor domain-containing protein [Clostridia bacterium]